MKPTSKEVTMPKPPAMSVVLALAIAAAPARSGAQPPALPSVSVKSHARARAVLDRALAAGGGAALWAVKDVTRTGSGTVFNQGQSLKPTDPYTTRAVEVMTVADFGQGRSLSETVSTPAGGLSTKMRAVLRGDSGFGHNLLTNVVTPSTPAALGGARTALRRDPLAILLTASRRAETLRSLGEDVVEGEKNDVVTFADADGTQIALYVSARTGLLSKLETLADNPVLGDAVTETALSDYRPVAGVQVPFRVVTRVAGQVTQDLKYTDIKVNTQPAASLFEAPAAAAQVAPAAAPTTVAVTKLAEDVFLLGGSSHNSLLVTFADHALLVEAPQSDDRTQALMARIKEIAPGKPVRYVVMTHYHFDHSGGLRGWIAQGATIVTTPGNKRFVEEMAAARHTIRPDELSRAPKAPVVETFTGKRVFSEGGRVVEIHDVGPNPHVAEIAVAYLPKERALFVADLFTIPVEGPITPAGAATRQFAEKIQALGLAVEKIVPAHGRVGTMDELRQVVSAGR
jgi:glyoxylase-like metal-dependent hydrolase (beta-lactamase superfamily II)